MRTTEIPFLGKTSQNPKTPKPQNPMRAVLILSKSWESVLNKVCCIIIADFFRAVHGIYRERKRGRVLKTMTLVAKYFLVIVYLNLSQLFYVFLWLMLQSSHPWRCKNRVSSNEAWNPTLSFCTLPIFRRIQLGARDSSRAGLPLMIRLLSIQSWPTTSGKPGTKTAWKRPQHRVSLLR